jgi:hypothetical protein
MDFSSTLSSLIEDIDPVPGVLVGLAVMLEGRAAVDVAGFDTEAVRFTSPETDARGRAVAADFRLALESGEGMMERREGLEEVEEANGVLAAVGTGALGTTEALLEGAGTEAEAGALGGIEDFVGGGPEAALLIGEVIVVGLTDGAASFETAGFAVPEPKVPELKIFFTDVAGLPAGTLTGLLGSAAAEPLPEGVSCRVFSGSGVSTSWLTLALSARRVSGGSEASRKVRDPRTSESSWLPCPFVRSWISSGR